jgi:hypothetical protein
MQLIALSVQVFGFGANDDGQLGVDDLVDRSVPTPLKSFALLRMLHTKTIVQVVAGAEHSVAIDDSGAVYTWGAGKSGQLGYGMSRSSNEAPLKQLTPRSVLPLHGVYIVQVASGGNHVLALADDGSVYSWGSGKNGRLGHGASQRDELRPKRISSLGQRALAVACVRRHGDTTCVDACVCVCVRARAYRAGRIRWRSQHRAPACWRVCSCAGAPRTQTTAAAERTNASRHAASRRQRCTAGDVALTDVSVSARRWSMSPSLRSWIACACGVTRRASDAAACVRVRACV